MAAQPLTAFTIPLRDWTGPAGRTLIQGLLIHPSGWRIIHQADDVAGQVEQDIVFRFHTASNSYLGSVTVKRAGHGSTCGLEPTGPTSMRLWMGHLRLGCIGYITVDVSSGKPVAGSFVRVAGLPRGDVSIDAEAAVLCLRQGNAFKGYDMASAKAGKPKLLWGYSIPAWGKRFQGHLIFRDRLFVHRDVETKGASRADCFDTEGQLVKQISTTGMGDEAEGFCAIGDQVFIVKRTGPVNASRIVQCTPWLVSPAPKDPTSKEPPVADKYVIWRGVRVNPESVPSLDKLAEITGPNIRVAPTQGGYNAGGVAASAGTHDRGAAMDLSVHGLTSQQISAVVLCARSVGWAAWYRPAIKGLWPAHVHMIRLADQRDSQGRIVADPTASSGAKSQVVDYRNGLNGLADRRADTGPILYGAGGQKRPTWAESIHNPANRRKSLAEYLTELGPVKDVSVEAINKARGTGNASRHVAVMQQWLNLAVPAAPLLTVDGIWSATGPTQSKLDAFRRGLGWTGNDVTGPVGPHSLSLLRNHPAVLASKPLPVREPYPTATK